MKLSTFVFITFSLLLFTNCDDETPIEDLETDQEEQEKEEPKEITYFTFSPSEFLETSETDDWLIVHDQSGKLLDYKAYEKDDELVFKEIDTALTHVENLAVTTVSVRQNDSQNSHRINTYTDVAKGINWNTNIQDSRFQFDSFLNVSKHNNLTISKIKSSSKKGPYTITVNNIPGILKYNITSAATGVVTADYNPIDSNSLVLENLEFMAGVNYIFFIGDAQGGLKHYFFEVDENSSNLVFNYDDFVDFEQIVETALPSNSYLFTVSRGYESAENLGRGYEMTVELDFMNPEKSYLGYIPGYESYSTVFHITIDSGYAYQYFERNSNPLQQINILPKPSFIINDGELSNFNFDTDIEYLRTGSSWIYEENFSDAPYQYTSWTIHASNKSAHVAGSLPEEITSKYPKIDLEKIKLSTTYFTIKGKAYQTYLQDLADPANSISPSVEETVILNHSQD